MNLLNYNPAKLGFLLVLENIHAPEIFSLPIAQILTWISLINLQWCIKILKKIGSEVK